MFPSKKDVQIELRKFIRVNTLTGVTLYVTDMVLYGLFIYGVIALPFLWMKTISGFLAGVQISGLSVIAHDAAHNSLVRSRSLNRFIAITSFLPCLFNYRLWLYDHNRMHHSRTNEKFPDSYTPLTVQEYNGLDAIGKWKYRKYRQPSLLYFGMYYILERWSKVKLYPTNRVPAGLHRKAWMHTAGIVAYLAVLVTCLVLGAAWYGTGIFTVILLGLVLPYYVFQSLYAMAVYVQHTHPEVPWFVDHPDRNSFARQELISVHMQCPRWVSHCVHHIFDHSAHHACPAIPCYMLGPAQARLNELMGEHAVIAEFSLRGLFNTMRKCQLYDYENHHWLDLDGNVTGMPLLKSGYIHSRAA